MKSTSLKSHAHCVSNLHAHIVFVTKYRKKVINAEILKNLEQIFSRLCHDRKCKLVEFNGESDHVHLLVEFSPDTALSTLVGSLKSVSSRLIRRDYPDHVAKFYWKPVFWTSAYCVITAGGAPLDVLKTYIQNQNEPEPVSPKDPVRR